MEATGPLASAVRGALAIASVAAIFAALGASGLAPALWRASLVATALFYALVHLAPDALFRLQSMPYTYQVHNNFGERGFELQNVTYAAYHTHWYNHATHAAFPVEAWLWLAAAALAGGPAAAAALAALLIAQAFSFGERGFALWLSVFWLACAASALWASTHAPEALRSAVPLGLVALGFWRFSGHWVEPLPPGVVGNRAFLPARDAPRDVRLLWPMALGYLSEFAAGLPFRLVNGWLFAFAQRLGYVPGRALSGAQTRALAMRIHAEGWSAQPTTARIVRAAHALEPTRESSSATGSTSTRLGSMLLPARDGAIRLLACDRGASVWLVSIAGRTILFDAWLDDPYVSGSGAFFSAERREPPSVGVEALPPLDAIVLSSAEQDHAHPRTLARLDRRVPVFAGRDAARIASSAGFASVTTLRAGVPEAIAVGAVSALALPGYGRNLAVVLRDERSGERVCIAQHGIQRRWLERNAGDVFRWQFARDSLGRLVDTLCLGVHTTLMRPPGVPPALLGTAATIVPDPRESADVVAQLAPRRVLFSHCTREAEQGFAVRHLLQYPSADDDLGHAERVLRERCPNVAIEGLPEPASWV